MRYLLSVLLLLTACTHQRPDSLDEISLSTTEGKTWNGTDLSSHAATVFIFFAPQCPLSENYCLQTNVLQAQYLSEGVQFFAVIPGALFSSEEINDFLQRYQLDVPVLLDPDKYLCDVLGATITPEAFLTDPAGQTLYSGAIDNWAVDLGKKREVVTEFYLRDAIDAILQKQPVPISKTTAVGCYIE